MTDLSQGGQMPLPGQQGPTFNVVAQYVKDLSFENPNTAKFLQKPPTTPPGIDLQVNVNSRQVGVNDYEVELGIEAKALSDDTTVFVAELAYAGIFRVSGIPQDQLGPLLLVDCPHLLFPFARQILAEATQNGGFAPLLLTPIDFLALYRQRMGQGPQAMAGRA